MYFNSRAVLRWSDKGINVDMVDGVTDPAAAIEIQYS
jgi:hypothetical protein